MYWKFIGEESEPKRQDQSRT